MTLGQFEQLVERLAPLLQILASLGVLFGIVTALIGFRRFLDEKARDRAQQSKDYLSALRKSIFISRPIFEELNQLLKYELFYEMASNVANSTPVSTAITDVYDVSEELVKSRYFSGENSTNWYYGQEEVRKAMEGALRERWNYFGVPEFMENPNWRAQERPAPIFFPLPLRTKLVELFKSNTSRIGTEIEPYRFDYPSLSRVLLSANRFFASLEDRYRRYVLDVERWTTAIVFASESLLYSQLQEQAESEEQGSAQEQILPVTQGPTAPAMTQWTQSKMRDISGPDQLKDRITQQVVYDWYAGKYWQDAEVVEAVLEIVQIVTKTYLSKSDDELLSIRTEEKKLRFAPIEQTPRPEQMLQEAFDGLKPVLTEFDRESYHALAKRIGDSNPRRP